MLYSDKSKKIEIIIVDDHEIVREGLSRAINLQEHMTVVRTCRSAKECLNAVRDFSDPVVIVFDIAMSGLCPFSTAEKIVKIRPRNKVIFHSGYLTNNLIARAKHAGASAYVPKSLPVSELIATINEVNIGNNLYPELQQDGDQGIQCDFEPVLSPREMEVLRYVAQGMTAKIIGQLLKISTRTAERHKTNIMEKLRVNSQVELARYAIREGFVIP